MFRKQASQIPINEAAEFFYQLKHAGFGDPPDETGELEGQFAVPVEEVLQAIATIATSKLRLATAYQIYSETVRHSSNTSLGEHFKEHADHEIEFADYFIRRATVLGGPVSLGSIDTPPATTDFVTILKILIRAEQESINELNQLHALLGSNPMRFEVESMMSKDQHHLDDLWQHLHHTARMPIFNEGVDPKLASMPVALPEQAQGKIAPPSPLDPLQGPSAGQHKLANLNKKVLRKLGFSLGPYESVHNSMYQPTGLGVIDNIYEDRKEIENLRGMLNRAPIEERGNIEAKYIKDKHRRGAIRGAVGGAIAGAGFGMLVAPKNLLTGALVGAPLGGLLGGLSHSYANKTNAEHYVNRAHAYDNMNDYKTAADMSVPLDPDTREYVENAVHLREQAHEEEKNYYKQQLSKALAQFEQSQQQLAQVSQQSQQLQQQVEGSQQQVMQALEQAKNIQQQALDGSIAAHSNATQAMQQSLSKSNELIRQSELSARMREYAQGIKEQLSSIVSTPAPPISVSEDSANTYNAQMQQQAEQQQMQQQAEQQQMQQQAEQQQPVQKESASKNSVVNFIAKYAPYAGAAGGAVKGVGSTYKLLNTPLDTIKNKVDAAESKYKNNPTYSNAKAVLRSNDEYNKVRVLVNHKNRAIAGKIIPSAFSGYGAGQSVGSIISDLTDIVTDIRDRGWNPSKNKNK